jgi:hypothetical protein
MLAASKIRRPVAFFLHGIGDALLALPALRAFGKLFEGRLALACERGAYDLFYQELPLRDLACINPLHSQDLGYTVASHYAFDVESVARQLGNCDLFISFVPWRSRYLDHLVALLAPRWSIGLAPGFDVSVPRRRDQHTFDQAFALPRLFDPSLELETFASAPRFSAQAAEYAAEIIALLPKGSRILAVHNETREDRTWPADRLQAALQAFLLSHVEFWAIILDMRSRTPVNGWNGWGDLQVVPCHGLPLDTLMCVLGCANLFLGVDSCMLHAADLWRIPSVGLFGPTHPTEFGCRLTPHCHANGHGTMTGVGIAEVVHALEMQLPNARGDAAGAIAAIERLLTRRST